MTQEELALLSDEQLNERVALELMGWEQHTEPIKNPDRSGGIAFVYERGRWYPPKDSLFRGVYAGAPLYAQNMHLAWQVVQRITRIPQSKEEATTAPNTRFMYAFQRAAHAIVCSSEQEAARWICEQALLAWHAGPLFPEESEQTHGG